MLLDALYPREGSSTSSSLSVGTLGLEVTASISRARSSVVIPGEASATSDRSPVIHRLTPGRLRDGSEMSQPGQRPTKGVQMSTTTRSSRTSYIQWLIESRPPSLTWSRSSPPQPNQPPLDLTDQEVNDAAVAVLDNRGVRVSLVKAGWAATQRPGLPDAREWSTTLALALIQALLGQRAVSQAILSKCALAKDQVATWTYSHGRAILVCCWRRCDGSRRPPGDVPRRR
jgi:hypothetical protein